MGGGVVVQQSSTYLSAPPRQPKASAILHDDTDYELAQRHLPDVNARRIGGD